MGQKKKKRDTGTATLTSQDSRGARRRRHRSSDTADKSDSKINRGSLAGLARRTRSKEEKPTSTEKPKPTGSTTNEQATNLKKGRKNGKY